MWDRITSAESIPLTVAAAITIVIVVSLVFFGFTAVVRPDYNVPVPS